MLIQFLWALIGRYPCISAVSGLFSRPEANVYGYSAAVSRVQWLFSLELLRRMRSMLLEQNQVCRNAAIITCTWREAALKAMCKA